MTNSEVTFRIRTRMRVFMAMVGASLLGVAALFVVLAYDMQVFVSGADLDLGLLRWFFVLVPLSMVFGGGYVIAYWWSYRIVLGHDAISRKGIPNVIDRRITISYTDIERITRGERSVVKIIPQDGRPLATNVKELDGGPEAFLEVLRERVPQELFDPDFEATLFDRGKRDRWMLVLGILALAILGIVAAATLFRETLLSDLAWKGQLELERGSRLLQAEVAPDGSLWVLVEHQDPYSAEIQQFDDGEAIQTARLADDPILRAALDRNEGQIGFFSSMAIDNSSRVWLNPGSGETVSWDGERWSGTDAATADGPRVDALAYGAGSVWALLSDQGGLLTIDPRTGTSREYPLDFDFPDGPVELLPDMLSATHAGGIVVAGIMNPGGLGLLSLDLNGNPSVLTFIPDPKSVGARTLQHVTGDAKGRIHLIYEYTAPCSNGFRRVKSGTRLADAVWVWRDLAYEADCSVHAGSDSIAVDPLGRTWVGNFEYGTHVFEAPTHQPLDAPLEPSFSYTGDNSGFNGRDLNQMRTGQILAARTFGRELVSIDAAQEELPAPLPEPLAWLIANSSLILFLAIPLIVILVWRQNKANFGRD